jgi:hypothetical protein
MRGALAGDRASFYHTPALRLAARPGASTAALAALVDGNPDDLASVLAVLTVTDPVARAAAGALAALPTGASYHGPDAAAVMLPFLCPRPSRFSTGRYGVLYGAESIDTAVAEVSHHHGRRLAASGTPAGAQILLSLWSFVIAIELEDLRGADLSIYEPDDYRYAQTLGQRLRDAGSPGIIYSSVRRHEGECLGAFTPAVVSTPTKLDDWRLIWDGATISETLRVFYSPD